MTRRRAVKHAVLLAFGMALGKMDVLKAAGGQLTCDLDQWGTIVFKYRGQSVSVPVGEVFAALKESHGQ